MEINLNWKLKLKHELIEYGVNVLYLALVFGVIETYQRLILASHDINYTNYGFAVVQALILGKVIMLGDLLKLGKRMESRPLIFSTLFKTIIFLLWVILFKIGEETIKGLIHGGGIFTGAHELFSENRYRLIGHILIVFAAFIPFFGIQELRRILGKDKIQELFFKSKP